MQSYLDIRSPGGGLLSEDGKTMFFTWNVTGTRHVFKLESSMSFPLQLTGGQNATTIEAVTDDAAHLILSRDTLGDEYKGLYLQSSDGGALKRIFHAPRVKIHAIRLAADGETLFYCTNERNSQGTALIKQNVFDDNREILAEFEGLWTIEDHDDAHNRLLLRYAKSNLMSEYSVYSIESGMVTPLLGQGENSSYRILFGATINEYIVQTNRFANFHRIYRYVGRNFSLLSRDLPHDVEYFLINNDRRRIFYGLNVDGYIKTYGLSATSYQELALPQFKDAEHVTSLQSTRDGRYTVFHCSSTMRPAECYVHDWEQNHSVRWTRPSAPEINIQQFVKPTLEYYPSEDGTKIPMFVYRPKDCMRNNKVIVNFHGGPETQARPSFSTLKQYIVECGFVFVEPNVRGSSGYGKKWLAADDGPKRLNVIGDIKAAGDFIKREWTTREGAPKIGVMGGSYGGYSALMAMTFFAGTFDAGVSYNGMSSLVTFLRNTAPYRRKLRSAEYGDLDKDYEVLEKLSPINYIDRICAPLLIVQGASDPRVPPGEAVQVYERAKAKGVEAELVIFPDEGHGMDHRHNMVALNAMLVEFFRKHLT